VESTKVQATAGNAGNGRAVLADFSVVFVKALAAGCVASVAAAGLVLALVRLGG
jgi:hypothetical protein